MPNYRRIVVVLGTSKSMWTQECGKIHKIWENGFFFVEFKWIFWPEVPQHVATSVTRPRQSKYEHNHEKSPPPLNSIWNKVFSRIGSTSMIGEDKTIENVSFFFSEPSTVTAASLWQRRPYFDVCDVNLPPSSAPCRQLRHFVVV